MLETRHNPEDRRTSLRIHTRLPLQWQVQTQRAQLADLATHWGLGPYLAGQQLFDDLDHEFDRALHDIGDPATIAGLRLLSSKLDLIAQWAGADRGNDSVEPTAVELSAEGLGFDHDQPLTPGTLLGIHLTLPGPFHLLSNAQVTRCVHNDHGAGYHLGLHLLDLPLAASRRLTRFVISHQETTA